jgi:hypothetical protein
MIFRPWSLRVALRFCTRGHLGFQLCHVDGGPRCSEHVELLAVFGDIR